MRQHSVEPAVRRVSPRYAWLVLTTLVATFFLVVVGAVVRVSGSGLGCPDWPLCHGRIIPPFEIPTLIEYSHRLSASAVSVLVVACAVVAWGVYRWNRPVLLLTTLSVGLLIIQVVLGGLTVLLGLSATMVTIHLSAAEGLFALLTILIVVVLQPRPQQAGIAGSAALNRFARLALWNALGIYGLLLSGAYVRGSGATLGCLTWPLCSGSLFPRGSLAEIHVLHRYVAAAVGVLALYTIWQGWRLRREHRALGPLSIALAILFAAQVVSGAANAWTFGAPASLALHLGLGTAVWGVAVAVATVGRRARGNATADPRASTVSSDAAPSGGSVIRDYIILTKPWIISLLVVTALGGMFLAARGVPPLGLTIITLFGGSLAAGGANALNQYFDRDIDALMRRTRRRPIPSHRITPARVLAFGLGLNVIAFLLLATTVNLLSAALAVSASAFYIVVYTQLLKRSTAQNIVIGGAAGAFPPLVGWAAVTGRLELPALYLFAIVFYWTPPHFWALSLLIRDDYQRASLPMLPVLYGERATAWHILLYTIILVTLTVLLFTTGALGWLYLAAAVGLGGAFVVHTIQLLQRPERAVASRVYRFSLLYLALLFAAIMVDSSLGSTSTTHAAVQNLLVLGR